MNKIEKIKTIQKILHISIKEAKELYSTYNDMHCLSLKSLLVHDLLSRKYKHFPINDIEQNILLSILLNKEVVNE